MSDPIPELLCRIFDRRTRTSRGPRRGQGTIFALGKQNSIWVWPNARPLIHSGWCCLPAGAAKEVLCAACIRMGFGEAVDIDQVFRLLVSARTIEPMGEADLLCVIEEPGQVPVSYPTVNRRRPGIDQNRFSTAAFNHSWRRCEIWSGGPGAVRRGDPALRGLTPAVGWATRFSEEHRRSLSGCSAMSTTSQRQCCGGHARHSAIARIRQTNCGTLRTGWLHA